MHLGFKFTKGFEINLKKPADCHALKRGFCSWICPFGLLTEYLNRLHKLIFRKNVKLPEMCGGVPGKRHALHFGLKTKGHPQTLGLFSGSLPAFYRRLVDGQNDRLLANRHLQQ